MTHSMQGIYSPLPQSLSDSDSEKEIVMENVCTNSNYRNNTLVHHTSRQNGHINPELLKIKHINPKMSTLRKTAFVFSLLLCCLPIIIFLWILPCSSSATCPVKIQNWEYQQDDIELKGRINPVYSSFKNTYNLVVMAKGSINSPKNFKHSLISFVGANGVTSWFSEQAHEPTELDCSVLDVDGNDINDCLVLDAYSLKAVDTNDGNFLWQVHSHDINEPISDLTMAVKLSDYDGDKISELLTIYKGSNFLIVSGSSGKALTNIKINACNKMSDLRRLDNKIRFTCRNGTIQLYEVALGDFHVKYRNSRAELNLVLLPRKKSDSNQANIYVVANRKLVLENIGKCPLCRSTLTLYDHNDNKIKLKVWSFYNSYIMKPLPFSFQDTKENIHSLKGHVNGFIVKIWQWTEQKAKGTVHSSRICKRSLPNRNETYEIFSVNERLMMIMFNNTDVHVINASLNEINQLCIGGKDALSCQPDHKNHEESVLIADLDQDKSGELVSYYSSYMMHGDTWHITSYFKAFRLEDELPKLYSET